MGQKKKSNRQNEDSALKKLILITAIANLIKSVVDLVKSLTG